AQNPARNSFSAFIDLFPRPGRRKAPNQTAARNLEHGRDDNRSAGARSEVDRSARAACRCKPLTVRSYRRWCGSGRDLARDPCPRDPGRETPGPETPGPETPGPENLAPRTWARRPTGGA